MREKVLIFLTFLATKHRRFVFVVSLILTLGLGAACGLEGTSFILAQVTRITP